MGAEYILVNESKKEIITFAHLNGAKMKELVGNAAQSAIVTWYLLNNQGDQIQFVSDTDEYWPFETGSFKLAASYPDRTNEVIEVLIENKILVDNGLLHVDKDEPDTIYTRDIVNVWCHD